jgi:F-type H+-transporting ATPase subunit epsilon
MADSFAFELVSPERLLMSGQVSSVVVPGREGQFTVLPGHAPVVATLKPGVLTIDAGASERRFFVGGGLAEVRPQGLTVLAEKTVDLAGVSPATLDEQIRNAEEDLADAKNESARAVAEAILDEMRQLKDAL